MAMAARASLIAIYSPPTHHHSPARKIWRSDFTCDLRFRCRILCLNRDDCNSVLLFSNNDSCKSRRSNGLAGSLIGGRKSWRVWTDVKSKPCDVAADSERDSLNKFGSALNDSILRNGEAVIDEIPWWEEFPKRWMIVLLCFSAFLLCNMDRVSY